jgi:hypothetical protein
MTPASVAKRTAALFLAVLCFTPAASAQIPPPDVLHVPFLSQAPSIDGNLQDWKDLAYTDGVWDIYRIQHEVWYDEGRRNRLTHQRADEPHPEDDLRARYYVAWDEQYLYLGAEVVDNFNDIEDPEHAPRRWMYKDSICWFIEAPGDNAPEQFARGDNAFCFVIDAARPAYNTWWRHGSAEATYLEEPIPEDAVQYALSMDPWGSGNGDFILEARIDMAGTFPQSDPSWTHPVIGDEYRMEIVHCDPDGGDYGGHFIIYGTGDNDLTWARMVFVGPQTPLRRLEK